MRSTVKVLPVQARGANDAALPRVGVVIESLDGMHVKVKLQTGEELTAQCLAHLLPADGTASLLGREAVLMTPSGSERSLVMGLLDDGSRKEEVAASRPQTATVDGKRVVLDAQEEIVLQCGKGSITLTADGRIVIKGTDIVSRALRTHKIKGGAVNIN